MEFEREGMMVSYSARMASVTHNNKWRWAASLRHKRVVPRQPMADRITLQSNTTGIIAGFCERTFVEQWHV